MGGAAVKRRDGGCVASLHSSTRGSSLKLAYSLGHGAQLRRYATTALEVGRIGRRHTVDPFNVDGRERRLWSRFLPPHRKTTSSYVPGNVASCSVQVGQKDAHLGCREYATASCCCRVWKVVTGLGNRSPRSAECSTSQSRKREAPNSPDDIDENIITMMGIIVADPSGRDRIVGQVIL